MKKMSSISILVLSTILLAGCKGSVCDLGVFPFPYACDDFSPHAPTPTLGYGIKTLQFSWPVAINAEFYRLYENPDGVSGYTQVGSDITGTNVDHPIALHRRLNASYIVAACNGISGCTDSAPLSVSANLVEAIGYAKASNTEADDQFGSALALSADGTTLAVGAPYEDSAAAGTGTGGNQADNSAFNAGAVYVFTRVGSAWSQQAYIKASNSGTNDYFGIAVALSADGNTLAVGAYGEASGATGLNGAQLDNSVGIAGAVYVYTRITIPGQLFWDLEAYVKASNTGAGDYFGFALALSADGNTLAVGAPGEASAATGINGDQTDNSANAAGAVYVYTRSASAWSQQAYVKATNTGASDSFGLTLALSADGHTLAVGSLYEDSAAGGVNGDQADNSATNAGAVYVFIRSGTNWSQQAYVKASNTGAGDNFGFALALSADGNTLAVGAFGEDSAATGIGGNEGDDSSADSGAVYIFIRSGTSWSQQIYVKASNTGSGDWFGDAVALSADGNTLAVGAPVEASGATGIGGNEADNSAGGSGAVYVFTRNGVVWSQQAYVKASNTASVDYFGAALALSANGATLAVGAQGESSATAGIGGDQSDNTAANSGAVYLY